MENNSDSKDTLSLLNFAEASSKAHEFILNDGVVFHYTDPLKRYDIESHLKEVNETNNLLPNYHFLQRKLPSIESFLSSASLAASSIQAFLSKVLTSKSFSEYQSIFLFVHSKGKLTATKHEITHSTYEQNSISIKDFNKFFLSIKKSKNRSFGQNELKGTNFDIIGTFMAREYALTYHNIIFVLSKNNFLSPTTNDQNNFQQLCYSLPFYLNAFLYAEAKTKQNELDSYIHEHILKDKALNKINPDKQADIFHNERLGLLGELLNTLRHELSNPLFGLQLSSQILIEDLKNETDDILFIQEIMKNITRSQQIIKNFSDLFIDNQPDKLLSIKEIIEEVITLTKSETRGILREVDIYSDIKIFTNPSYLVQVLFNLVINSAQELQKSKIQDPKISFSITEEDKFIEIHIKDNGPGIPEEIRELIFKPFFTTKEKGTGLGLSISKGIVERLGGELLCHPNIGGAHFSIKLARDNN